MYTYKGVSYTEEEIKEAAKQSGITVQEYLDRLKEADPKSEDEQEFSSEDLLDPTTFQADAAAGAGVVSQPMQAPDTELVSEDTSLDLQDSKSFDFEKIQASLFPKTIDGQPAPRLQQEKFAIEDIEKNRKIKAEYYTDQQEDLASNVSQKKIISEEAIDIFGPIEPRDAKTPKVSSVVTPGVSPTVYLAPKFNSDKEYDDYLKNTLGNDYNSYLNYLKTGEIDVSTKETRLNARKKVVQRQAELFTIANDIPEEVQKYMMFEPEFATGNSKEEQEFAIDLIKKNYDDTYKNYLSNIDKWKKEAVPLSKEIDKIQTQLKDFEYDKNNQPIITNQEELDKYNLLATQNNNILQQWEKQGFNVLYNNLIKQEEVLEIEQDNYYEMLDDSRKAMVDADALTKAISKDYSSSARIGRAWDEFFIQSTRNVLDLGLMLGTKALDWVTDEKYDNAFNALTDVISQNNKNYNLEMAKKREDIPSAPTLDEIDDQDVDYWDWFSISFQDNSPVIATTFVPGGASLKGGQLVKSAATTAAKKIALRQQKNLLLAGKRTAQTIFFTAETGGKFGELQLEAEDYSLLQKAFTAFSFGTAATYAETLGSIKLVTGGRNLAKKIGTQAAKKEYYTRPSRFALNVVGKSLSGLKSIPRGLATEQIEEVATQVAHNLFDITILNKDKSLIDGLNKDFFANVAVTSFGIMAPTTSGNVINAAKNEFITRDEILNNQKLTTELINLNESESTIENRNRKKEILEELALSDAISLHKLRYMSESDIERVTDLNRQMRQLQGKMNALGKTGERSKAAKRKKVEIETEYKKLVTAQQEILNSKQRSLKQREKVLNEKLGAAAQNTEAAYWLGVNDFYNEVAMTQMGDGDYVILGEENISEQLSKYEGKTIKVKDQDGKEVEVDLSDYILEKVNSDSFYGVRIGKDIIINQPLIDAQIGLAPTSKEAQWAAVAPLEELFHISVAGKKVKFDGDAKKAVDEIQQILDDKLELKEISQEFYDEFADRIKLYTEDGKVDIEEFIAQLNNAVALNDMNLSDFNEAPTLKTFLNNSIRSVFGDMSWMLNLKTSGDVFNLIKNFQKDVEKQVIQTAPEDEELKESIAEQSSQDVQRIYEEQGPAGAFEIIEKFKPITSKLVERRSEAPNFDRQLLTDEIETGKRGILDLINEYKPESGVPLAAYINKFLPARAIEASKRVLGEEFTADVTEARGVVAAEVTDDVTVEKEVRGVRKPTETTKFKPNYLDAEFKKSLDPGKTQKEAIEDKISSTIKESFKDRPVSGFKQTGKIPQKLAQLYADMFGIKTTSALIEKQRNLQKLDEEGAIKVRQFLVDNAQSDFARLPRSKDDMGKATGILQTKIGKVLYDKAGKLTGSLKTYTDIIKGKNITLEGYDGKQYEFNKLDETGKKKPIYRDAQHIKAALDFHIRNRALETLIPEPAKRAQAGAKFSLAKPTTSKGLILLAKVSQAASINDVAKILGIPKVTVNDNNRAEKIKQMSEAIVSAKIPSWMFLGSKFGNFARRKVNGVRVDLPARGGLYYGTKDPAYQDALALAKQNDNLYDIQPPKRVSVKKAFTESGQTQGKLNLEALEFFGNKLADAVAKNQMPLEIAALFVTSGYQATTGIIKIAAPFKYKSKVFKYGTTPNQKKGDKFREEHNPPASVIGANLIYAIASNSMNTIMPAIKENYYQTQLSKADDQKIDEANLAKTLPEGTTILDNTVIRLVKSNIDMNSLENPITGKTLAQELGVTLESSDINLDNIAKQNELISEVILGDISAVDAQKYLDKYALLKDKTKASKVNNNNTPSNVKFSKAVTNQETLDNLGKIDEALSIARNPNSPVKKIRVFDFDDTLARSKSRVIYEMPDGKTGFLTATEFANKAGEMETNGATFDFSEFSKVIDGKKGPLFEVAKFINDAKGERDVFVLTARPADAAGPIKEFLSSMGLNIPLKNITGLGDGTPQAKARWIVDKAAEGYNDFYFADDASKNVKAVKEALDVLDVKSKVQQAQVRFSKTSLDKQFNDIIEAKTGIASEKRYGKAKAQVAGASRGKAIKFVPYSAQDFVGLLYETLSKGKLGDAQMAWYQENLIRPFARAMNDLSSARLAMMNDYRALKKELKIVPKNLRKKIQGEPWTKEQAVRVYIWNKQGLDIPGISKADLKDLTEYVANDAELQVFADQLIAIQKGDAYPAPKESWVSGSISTDLLQGLNTVKRAKYLEQWQRNVDEIFSQENKNKLQAAYGEKYVKALENSLQRMKTGRNRLFSDDSLTGRFTDWLQGSVGAIMFFNTRSALLQTISAVNFINFTDNNPIAAAKAFGNQKQYWKDFVFLLNSDFLKERRAGLRMNVSESDIADMAKQEGPRGVINKLLQLGFAPTQIADSFAIASGGATFYRNRVKTYLKDGLDQKAAEQKAFEDFRENAEESQQSSRPDRISMQQAGPLGRLILAFANTPAQYARLTDKAIRDLRNGRGDAKTNISKIVYYMAVQNLIFNAVQQALFAMAFGDEEEEDEKKQEKYLGIVNGMADSILRGTGFAGAAISVGKNSILRIMKEAEKKRPKFEKVGYELTKISPPISAKLSRINQAARSYQWNKEEMKTKGFSLDNPAFLAGGNVVSALTNIPLDRAVKKVNNVVKATDSDLELWERLALFGGWQDWEIGLKEETKTNKPQPRKLIKRKREFKTKKFKIQKFK